MSEVPNYFKNASASGPMRYRQLPGAIGVVVAPDNHMPIGMASEIGRREGGLAVWSLRGHGARLPGRLVVIDVRLLAVEADVA